MDSVIAVVGMSCRFPGAAGPEQFWRVLHDGADLVGDVPAGRWSDQEGVGRGGFLDRVDEFDAEKQEGENVEVGINNRYMLDALRNSKAEHMLMEINGPLSPIKHLPETGSDFTYLVLPVRFKNE